MLSGQLKSVLEQESTHQTRSDKEILQNMISQIKSKYQTKRGLLADTQQQFHLKVESADAEDDAADNEDLIKAVHFYK